MHTLGNRQSVFKRLSTIHLFLLLPWVGIAISARKPIRDNSFLWHVRAGDVQIDSEAVLTQDPFSFTFAGEAWRTQSWLADLMYGALDRRFGFDYVPWLIGFVAVAVVVLIGVSAYRLSASLTATAATVVLVAWLSVSFLSPRPVLFSYLFLAALFVVLEREKLRWAIPLIVWIWAAVHGSFVVGIGLIVLHRISRRRPMRADVAVAVVVASLTAHGLGIWQMLIRFYQNRSALDFITEWAPPKLINPQLAPYLAVIALLVWGAASSKIDKRDLVIVLPFLLFGLTSARSLFPAVVVLAPFIAQSISQRLAGLIGSPDRIHTPPKVAVAVLIVALPFLVTPEWPGLSEERFPTMVAGSLSNIPTFHDDVVGGYLIYAYPEIPVFVDDRAELYGAQHFRDLLTARRGAEGWVDVFDAYGIEQALLSVDDGLTTVLELEGWHRVAESDQYVVMRAA